MNRRQYAPIWKNISLVIQLILTVIFVISVFLLSALIRKNMLDTTDISNTNFMDSGCYSELFKQKTDELIDFLKLRDKFEENGEYQPNKIMNVLEYAKDGALRATASSNNHVVIITQDQEGNYAYEESSTEGTSSKEATGSEEDSSDTEALLRANKAKERAEAKLANYVLSDLVNWSKAGYTTENGVVKEDYLPIGGKSIADSLNDGDITIEQADRLYDALELTLASIGEEETSYKKGLNEFQTDESNLAYSYSENGEIIYSNVSISEDSLAYARAKGSYLYYNDENLKFRTNVDGMESYFYDTLDSILSGFGNGAQLMIAVDTSFPYADAFTDVRQEYNTLHPWVMVSIVALVVSIFGWIISLVYLTLAAGHKENDNSISLGFFDRIKTELFFGMFVMITVALIAVSFAAAESSWDVPGMLVMAGVSAFIYDLVFLAFYLSMVRRVKAGVLWEYSFLHWTIRSTGRVVHTWRSSVRVIVIYILNMVLFITLTYCGFAGGSVAAIVLLLIFIMIGGVLYLRNVVQHQEIMKGIGKITDGDLSYKLPLDNLHGDNCELAEAVNSIGDGLRHAVDESTKNERMKADLITNVSHDIKTPLTSIINYVNLLKMEKIEDKRIRDYINILDEKSQRLRQLTEDLVEASRISSGNITLQMTKINLVELIYQTGGEFNEKFENKDLTTITKLPKDAVIILADGRRIWRVVENLYNNVAKYAMAHTRVYVTMEKTEHEVHFEIKNISEQPLNMDSTDLTERFVRGDEARTTEGSGLGLSIARNLTTLMGGRFDIELDGDLFTATIIFPLVED